MHGACIGAGVEMVSAADMRFCTADTKFAVKEVDIGLAADVGGLQRFPKLVGNQSLVRELVFSCRNMSAAEAQKLGFVSSVFPSHEEMRAAALELAASIASKSPVAVMSAKTLMNYTRDHTVDEGLEYAITWNMGILQGKDTAKAAKALATKQKASFKDLPDIKP